MNPTATRRHTRSLAALLVWALALPAAAADQPLLEKIDLFTAKAGGSVLDRVRRSADGKNNYWPAFLTPARFNLAWLTDGRDAFAPPVPAAKPAAPSVAAATDVGNLVLSTAADAAPAGRSIASADAPQTPRDRRNVIVFKEPGRYGGWPANHGMSQWGNELVVGFTAAWYKPATKDHAVDRSKPFQKWQARSLDGGQTWAIEKPAAWVAPPPATPLRQPLDFTHPDFALVFGFGSLHVGPSHFFVSTDRCRSWQGPYAFQVEGIDKIAARTDYIVLGPRECLMFGSAAKSNDREGRVFCARTTDGGLTWQLVSLIGPEPGNYAIMPSSVRLPGGGLLTTFRHTEPKQQGTIDAYRSDDGGRTWTFLGLAAPNIGGGNPPALVRMADGRLALSYGYRARPWGVRARVSADQGRTWGPELILRDDALSGDLGYPRSVQRPDGKLITFYYFNGPRDEDRAIEATIWRPD